MKALASILAGIIAAIGFATTAFADQPHEGGIWFQEAGSHMMERIEAFGLMTFGIITVITIFVLLLLIWVVVRYNKYANPTPSTFTHNTTVEVVWTVVPILVLFVIAIPSFQLLDDQLLPEEEPTLTVKAIGQQWYWDYEYQDESELSFSSYILKDEDRDAAGKADKAQYPRLLAVDNELVVPVNEMIRVLVTADSGGVIHSFALPAFGLKIDAVPGRNNETWFKAEKEGLYYGQCSELCGINHAFMPIAIRVVSREKFDAWQKQAAEADLEAANKALMAAVDVQRNLRLANNQDNQ